jgi:geranylgeranyl diphosphate synthase type II
LKKKKKNFEDFFYSDIFSLIKNTFHSQLSDSCIYSLKAGGKRIRPILLMLASNSEDSNSLTLASSIECMHTYSLIHDDLPSMDNDDFRRGLPTNHKQFSESTAILAGDALNSFSFYLCSRIEKQNDPEIHKNLIEILHFGGGGPGMVSGQVMDLYHEKTNEQSSENLKIIHSLKTGSLITATLLMGNRLREDYMERENFIRKYGEELGILFQITDDILDEESSFSELGKTPGKDSAMGKLTYPSLFGMEESKKLKNIHQSTLEEIAEKLKNPEDKVFKILPAYIAQRKN